MRKNVWILATLVVMVFIFLQTGWAKSEEQNPVGVLSTQQASAELSRGVVSRVDFKFVLPEPSVPIYLRGVSK